MLSTHSDFEFFEIPYFCNVLYIDREMVGFFPEGWLDIFFALGP
jgi:hypothetical protein